MKWFMKFFNRARQVDPVPHVGITTPMYKAYNAFPIDILTRADYLQVDDIVCKSRYSANSACLFPLDIGAIALKDGAVFYHNPNYKEES